MMFRICLVVLAGILVTVGTATADSRNGRLDIYFIDVEGGAATLLVTPAGESVLIDSGYPDNHGRDLDRIVHVARDVAGLSKIDHAVVSHWHMDHYGNHAALAAKFGVGTFWDRGIPDILPEDGQFEQRIAAYRAAAQNQSRSLKAGDSIPLKSSGTPFTARVLTSGREVVANNGPVNAFADRHVPAEEDKSDNAASLSVLFDFGGFRFLCCGDLTWNVEARLVTPNNAVGTVDLFMVTHHGLATSNNPALVLAIDPTVAVMCNGPTKGGDRQTLATLREVKSLKDLFQLHRNVNLADDQQAPAEFIANGGTTETCKGQWVKASVAPEGTSFTVQIGPEGKVSTYETREK
ncbi:MAG: MBL fold metallo-hydrolase [Planctomycetaceae bacterium]